MRSVVLHDGFAHPKDRFRPIVDGSWVQRVVGERLVRSERYWQGAWVTMSGHIITGWTDNYLTERLTVERPKVRERWSG